jgi:ComF family protein
MTAFMPSRAPSRFSSAAVAALRPVADGVLSILLAPVCAACRRPLPAPTLGIVCSGCWEAIRPIVPPFCPVCSNPVTSWRVTTERCSDCRLRRPHIAAGRAVGAYDGPLRSILQAFKYERRRSLAVPLGRLMRLGGAAVLADADSVVPVPLHWRRRWRRGFNQALELARELGPPVRCALRRRRSTRTQTDLPAHARFRNVRGAFVVVRRRGVSGLRVVVVDDVSTTGATLDACARVLRDAGAAEVRTLTAARVLSQPPAARRR